MKRLLITAVVAPAMAVGALIGIAPDAKADPGYDQGCETIKQPELLNWLKRRTICDGPRRADGSWERTRVFWTPAHTTSASSYCGTYSCSYTPSRYYEESVQGFEQYVVFDTNVLPGEPAWIPSGTVRIL